MRLSASLALAAFVLTAAPAGAWPASLQQALLRDARRLVPKSLAKLIGDREVEVLEETARFPPALGQAVTADLARGTLSAATLAALQDYSYGSVALLRQQRVTDGVVALGATLRIPADLSDPILTAGAEGFPAGVAREYYAFIEANLGKLPVTLSDEASLKLPWREIPRYWQGLVEASRPEAPIVRRELFRNGRVLDHRYIDFRSHVFGVAQISYSRAVTAIAATWLALWRDARGDLTREPKPHVVAPVDAPPLPPEATLPPLPPEAEP